MAFKVIWSESACNDLQQIVQFIAHDSQDAAARLAERILEHIELASTFPWANRIVPEKRNASIREIILRPYRIIYMVDKPYDSIQVLRIWHGARGMPIIEDD